MTSKKHKHEVPAVYKPIALTLPEPENQQHFMFLVQLMNVLNYVEFMRRWRWEKKLVKWSPIMELEQVPVNAHITLTDPVTAMKNKEGVVGPN